MAELMPDGRRRSREHWTDAMEDGPPAAPAHTHRLPRIVRLAVVGLVAAVFLLAVGLGMVAVQVYKANQYVQGRGEYRDREAVRIEQENEERNRKLACDMADQFPEGGWLDRLRATYGCGPGIPIADLPPEEQKELANRRSNVAPAPVAPLSPFGTPIVPAPSSQAPQREAAQPAPEPSPEPGPLVDPSPVTDLVCGLVDACP